MVDGFNVCKQCSWRIQISPQHAERKKRQMASKFFAHNSWGGSGFDDGTPYVGPVVGIKTEIDLNGAASWNVSEATDESSFINITPRALALPGTLEQGPPMNFIDVSGALGDRHGGPAFVAHADHIINGGSGSSFIVGGAGKDIFYVDGRLAPTTDPSLNTWSTLKGLHIGDSASVWGMTPQDFNLTWLDSAGAPGVGNAGLTAVFVAEGKPEIGVTFAGLTRADLNSGHLQTSYGQTSDLPGLPGSAFFHAAIV